MKRTDIEKALEQEAISLGYQEKANSDAKRQKRDGVVVTPYQAVDFQIRSTIAKMKEEFGLDPDENIEWADPFGGGGIYTARLLQIADLSPERKAILAKNCIVVELCPIAAQICADNLAAVFREETGMEGFVRVVCADTFSLPPDTDLFSLPFVEPSSYVLGGDIVKNYFLENNFSDPCVVTLNGRRFRRRHAITDGGLTHFREPYPDMPMTKTDVFFFIYGFLHSLEYQEKYSNNLSKELPRIPRLRKYDDFKSFELAGRQLAHWHLNYDEVEKYEADISENLLDGVCDYRVEKMKFGKHADGSKDKTTIIYNDSVVVRNIPIAAYDYMCGSKSAIEWVMDRQGIKKHKESGIINDANDFAIETMESSRYPLDLLLRIITVSLRTVEIVQELPPLDIFGGCDD